MKTFPTTHQRSFQNSDINTPVTSRGKHSEIWWIPSSTDSSTRFVLHTKNASTLLELNPVFTYWNLYKIRNKFERIKEICIYSTMANNAVRNCTNRHTCIIARRPGMDAASTGRGLTALSDRSSRRSSVVSSSPVAGHWGIPQPALRSIGRGVSQEDAYS